MLLQGVLHSDLPHLPDTSCKLEMSAAEDTQSKRIPHCDGWDPYPIANFGMMFRMLSLATIRQDNLDPHDTAKDNRGLRRKQSYHYEQGSNSTTSDNGLCMSRSSGIGSRKSDRRVHFTPEKSSPLHVRVSKLLRGPALAMFLSFQLE